MTKTAEARRRDEKIAYDSYLETCPSRLLLGQLGDKWVVLVLTALEDGPLRYMELSRRIAGVSQKMLTQTTRRLERDGLVTRTVTAAVPVQVDYELTPLGVSLLGVVRPLKEWAERNIGQIRVSQEVYDTREG